MLKIETKSLLFLFLAYNFFLAAALVSVLAAPLPPSQTNILFNDSDFGPPTPSPSPPVRVSKPFYENPAQMLSFKFEEYGTNNTTQLTIFASDCGACGMAIAALPLGPPPAFAKNGTILGNIGATYNVPRPSDYVLLFDLRGSFCELSGFANCTARLYGTVTATAPSEPSLYPNLTIFLTILGVLAIIPPTIWTLQKYRHAKVGL